MTDYPKLWADLNGVQTQLAATMNSADDTHTKRRQGVRLNDDIGRLYRQIEHSTDPEAPELRTALKNTLHDLLKGLFDQPKEKR